MSGIINSPRHGSHPDCRAPLIQIDAPQFEPGVVAAVDLNELAQAGSTVARLVDLGSSLATGLP